MGLNAIDISINQPTDIMLNVTDSPISSQKIIHTCSILMNIIMNATYNYINGSFFQVRISGDCANTTPYYYPLTTLCYDLCPVRTFIYLTTCEDCHKSC
jgi:hypothetical protein